MNSRIDREQIRAHAAETIRIVRGHWLKQVLDWPLGGGTIASRLTEAEISELKEAVERGELFVGSPTSPA